MFSVSKLKQQSMWRGPCAKVDKACCELHCSEALSVIVLSLFKEKSETPQASWPEVKVKRTVAEFLCQD